MHTNQKKVFHTNAATTAHVHSHNELHHGHHHHEHGLLPASLYLVGLGLFIIGLLLEKSVWQSAIFLVAMGLSGFHVLFEGVVATIEESKKAHALRANAHILMFIAALGAIYLGDIKEGALLIFIFAGVHFLEDYVSDKSKKAIEDLLALKPQIARKIQADGQIIEVSADAVKKGDQIQVLNGMQIPIDGMIVKGSTTLNEATITGEALPVEKTVGDVVFGSTLNLSQTIEITATKEYKDTVFAKIVQIVKQAQQNVPPLATKIQRYEPIYVNVVLGVFLAILILGELFFRSVDSPIFEQALIFLVAASPCALAVSVIPATLSAMSNLARKGVLFKGGNYIYLLKDLSAIAFDKTGTLTQGQPSVVCYQLASTVFATEKLEQIIYSMEAQVSHPLAQAIVEKLAKRYERLAVHVTNEVGKGLSATYDQHKIQLGKASLFPNVSPRWQQVIKTEQLQGRTVILVVIDQEICGYFAIEDQVKATAATSIQQLNKLGIQSIMLTGDSQITGEAIAKRLGMDKVYSNVLPDEKAKYIQELKKYYPNIAMVGDGINDAPALALADVGFAMEQGSDIAIETADAVMMKNDLTKLVDAIKISKHLSKIVQQNVFFAIAVVILLVGLTFTNHLTVIASVSLHEGSTLIVLLNSLRLLIHRP
ncbi:heavy metal translocating P-type ATPase [Enterococcus columbae]|uniref:Cadmium-translocating P-type ATPase n=1 Tax=Enterococcus columbae DSM 7374 = ATCC 51263 TaxID=1121865 RepID=S0KIU0_9ENTE|nr:heavy metal translocating P-type ATPase [Enterococcus columbae]EOT44627.1 cadmium-translocating P-type ATPase [Enterococcus columbae DSM 7374 = ATCC 51263]EOW87477.1 cadmium-translocating P-type ATPase [Enterococcus columbae DSM 7374 = ATCC 51263]OJG25134.1 cadmium-translocating P-type ATPase [Enterococcus columbae DSM 7374 = ATCC 51263]